MTDNVASDGTDTPISRRILVNDASHLVSELIDGYVSIWSNYIRLDPKGLIVRLAEKPSGRVGLAIGNGLGHEPAMMGFVGPGLFDVNIPGELFGAPGPLAILDGIRAADRGVGVLLCVSNHSGDVLSAEMALRMLEAADPDCRILLLWDDISTSPVHGPERRGGSGLLFVWKIVGAAAESGMTLDDCERIGAKVRDNLRSLSAVFGGTENPITGNVVSPVIPGTALVGAGVHGDSTGDVIELVSADSITEYLIERIATDLGIGTGEHCGLIVNDAGAMSVVETTLVARAAKRWLEKRGVIVDRMWCGRYATTLATAGVGISVCKFDDELLRLWDMQCRSAAMSLDEPGHVNE